MGNALSLDSIVNIEVTLPARATSGRNCDLVLLIGADGGVYEAGERMRLYSSPAEMLADGFLDSDRVYKAAALVLGQSPAPSRVAVAIIGEVPEEGGTTRPETIVETLAACRAANDEWYAVVYCASATDADHLDAAAWAETASPSCVYAYTTADPACLTSGTNIFTQMKAAGRRRAIGQYSTKHDDAVAAIMGYAAGMLESNNPAFTLAYKKEQGVTVENSDASVAESAVSRIKANNGNVYVNRGGYTVFEEGACGDGTWFDEVILLDKYTYAIQKAVMDLLTGSVKIPQTEGGMTMITAKVNSVCSQMRSSGFIAEGDWKGEPVKALQYGDVLPGGFLVQTDAIDAQPATDREARKAPNIYISLKLAGAEHYVTIKINANR